MAEKKLTLIGRMDKVWMNAIEEDDGAPGCEVDLSVRLEAMRKVLALVQAQRPEVSEQVRVAVIGHLRAMEKELLRRQTPDVDGYDDWFWKIAKEFASFPLVVTDEDRDLAADAIREIVGLEKFPHRILKRIVQVGLATVGVRTAHETIEGVYHSEDASGTDRIETDSRLYFLGISDEYDGKRIAVHIEILEN